VGAETDRLLEVRHGFREAAFVGQRVGEAAVDDRQCRVQLQCFFQLSERVAIGPLRQERAPVRKAHERVLIIQSHTLFGDGQRLLELFFLWFGIEVEHPEDHRIGQEPVGLREIGVERDGAPKEPLRLEVVFAGGFVEVLRSEPEKVPGLQGLWRYPFRAQAFRRADARFDARGYGRRDLVLHLEHLFEGAVILLGPDQSPSLGFNQVNRDTELLTELADAALHDVVRAELPTDVSNITTAALEGEGGVARNDEQRAVLGQEGDDVLTDTVRKVILLRVTAHVVKWEHGHGRLAPEFQRPDTIARTELGSLFS
jgi:hypothetical protein